MVVMPMCLSFIEIPFLQIKEQANAISLHKYMADNHTFIQTDPWYVFQIFFLG